MGSCTCLFSSSTPAVAVFLVNYHLLSQQFAIFPFLLEKRRADMQVGNTSDIKSSSIDKKMKNLILLALSVTSNSWEWAALFQNLRTPYFLVWHFDRLKRPKWGNDVHIEPVDLADKKHQDIFPSKFFLELCDHLHCRLVSPFLLFVSLP